MTLRVGSNKIKDTGAYGVYFCPGKTNCLIYTPKNINLTLSNGILTLKAGGKVYNRNGLLATTNTDLQATWPTTGTAYVSVTANGQHLYICNYPGETVSSLPSPSTSYKLYYNTSDGKCYFDVGSWVEMSFPIAIVSATGQISSIDQTFDWCGYIGSTAFVLPSVKGLIPDGFNADGTYKSIEFEIPNVSTMGYSTHPTCNCNMYLYPTGLAGWINTDDYRQETYPSGEYNHVYIPSKNEYWYNETGGYMRAMDCLCGTLTVTSGRISSLTPYGVKTTNDLQAINAIHNGSQLVYQYLPTGKTFNPSGSFQTYVVPKGVKKLQVDCVAAKGNGNGYGGRVQCVLSVTPGQTLYLAVGSANTGREIPTYNASDIRTNGNGITDTTSLQSRLVVAGGGGNTGNQAGSGGHGGGLTGAAGSDVDGKSGQGGTQSAGGAGGANGYWGSPGSAGGFGLGGRGDTYNVGGCGGAGWYGGGGGGSSAYGSTLGGNGGGGSSYTNSSRCTSVVHTQGYRNGNGYITLTPIR